MLGACVLTIVFHLFMTFFFSRSSNENPASYLRPWCNKKAICTKVSYCAISLNCTVSNRVTAHCFHCTFFQSPSHLFVTSTSVLPAVLTKRDSAGLSLKGENPGQVVAAEGSKVAAVVEAVETDRSCLQRSWTPSWMRTMPRYENIWLHVVCDGCWMSASQLVI